MRGEERQAALPPHPAARVPDIIDGLVLRLGLALCGLNLVLAATIVTQVTLRHGFGGGHVFLEELQWHFYAVAIMFGVSYRSLEKGHVRVDVLSRNFKPRTRALVDILGNTFLLLPFTVVLIDHGIDFAYDAYRVGESSDSPLGLPHRWIIKSVIPVSMSVLLLVCLSNIWRDIVAWRRLSPG